jgi:hypothetical protein
MKRKFPIPDTDLKTDINNEGYMWYEKNPAIFKCVVNEWLFV